MIDENKKRRPDCHIKVMGFFCFEAAERCGVRPMLCKATGVLYRNHINIVRYKKRRGR
jgi:hypothetical protein